MLPILLLLALFVVGAALIIKFTTQFAERLTSRLVTNHFRAAEYILEHHQAPKTWMRPTKAPDKPQLLSQMDKLITYFEACPLFEDEDSRTLLLTELRAEREGWKEKPLELLISKAMQPQP